MTKFFVFLLWAYSVYLIGISLFAKGFLLTRDALTNTSVKTTPAATTSLFKKSIVLIIDAFKYEFALYNESETLNKPYLNKFPVSLELERDNYGVLLEALADPPTTTLQRLKGLTTGSLPTFIDASKNFGSSVIEEDNWIHQLGRNNKSIVFAGDDTWMDLYPDRFLRSYPYPSFNIRDLNTVDKGVVRALDKEFGNTDWDVFIGHFLGVDHVGHTFGPNHVSMSNKLAEMNSVIRNVTRRMSEDTVLFVLGDHGMTKTGDHGGDSRDELSSAFLVYNKKYRFEKKSDETLSQIDFVPTMCLWLGLPIPFSNLGCFLPLVDNDYFNHNSVKSNVGQVMKYFDFYSSVNRKQFPRQNIDDIRDMFDRYRARQKAVMNAEEMYLSDELGFKILNSTKRICQNVWAKFDLTSMMIALTLVFIHCAVLTVLASVRNDSKRVINSRLLTYLSGGCTFGGLTGAVAFDDFGASLHLAAAFSVMIFGFAILWRLRRTLSGLRRANPETAFCLVLASAFLFASTSNSYVVEEGYVLHFTVMSAAFLSVLFSRRSTPSRIKLFILINALLLRLAVVYFRCREEQETSRNCSSLLDFHKSIGNLSPDISRNLKNWRFFFTLLSVFCGVVLPRIWLQKCGNLNGIAPAVSLVKYAPCGIGVCMVSYWALQGLPSQMAAKLLPWQQNILAQCAFATSFLTAFVVICKPALVYLSAPKSGKLAYFDEDVSTYFRFLKSQWGERIADNDRSSKVVYGLGTAISAPHIAVVVCVALASMLVLGDGLCPSVAVMMAVMACILMINAVNVHATLNGEVDNRAIILWWLAQNLFFYTSGHQATFPSIQWNAAFVGFSGDDYGKEHYVLPVILVAWNTFVSRILYGLALPLLASTSFSIPLVFPGLFPKISPDGELTILERGFDVAESRMFYLLLKYSVLSGFKLFASMLSAAVLRRHLMVWKIFAPKLIFEAVGFLVTLISVFAGYLLWIRIFKSMAGYYSKISPGK